MTQECFNKKYLVANIASFLDLEDINKLYILGKSLNNIMNPLTNRMMNTLFYDITSKRLYKYGSDEDDATDGINRKNLLASCWKSEINWRVFLIKANHNINIYPDKKIAKRVLNCLKIHSYLPDLRKPSYHLDYKYNSIHQEYCYDVKFKENCMKNYYGKYINRDYMNNHRQGVKINVLKRGLFFEETLQNFSETFDEIMANEKYLKIKQKLKKVDNRMVMNK